MRGTVYRVNNAPERIQNSRPVFSAMSERSRISPALREIRPSLYFDGDGREQVLAYAKKFAESFQNNPSSTFRQVVASGFRDDPVTQPLISPNANDSFEDLSAKTAYQGLVWMLRCLPKHDCHVHVSRNIHEDEIAIETGASIKHVKDSLEENDDYYIDSYERLEWVIKSTCLRFFEDGVESFDIRLNPLKDYENIIKTKRPADKEIRNIVDKYMECVERGIEAAVEEAKRIGVLPIDYISDSVGILLSLNRGKPKQWCRSVEDLAFLAFDQIKNNRLYKGIDISGDEVSQKRSNAPILASSWQKLIEAVSSLNEKELPGPYIITTHLDFRMSWSSNAIANILRGFPDNGEDVNSVVISMLRKYVEFVEPFIDLLPPRSGVGHGYILYPDYLITPLWDGEGHPSVLGVDLKRIRLPKDIDEAIARIRSKAAENKLYIEHNPIAAFRDHNTVGIYRRSMVYGMTGNSDYKGIGLKIGTDAGIFSWNRPRTLSDALARIFVSAPEDSTVTINQILGMVNCELV